MAVKKKNKAKTTKSKKVVNARLRKRTPKQKRETTAKEERIKVKATPPFSTSKEARIKMMDAQEREAPADHVRQEARGARSAQGVEALHADEQEARSPVEQEQAQAEAPGRERVHVAQEVADVQLDPVEELRRAGRGGGWAERDDQRAQRAALGGAERIGLRELPAVVRVASERRSCGTDLGSLGADMAILEYAALFRHLSLRFLRGSGLSCEVARPPSALCMALVKFWSTRR